MIPRLPPAVLGWLVLTIGWTADAWPEDWPRWRGVRGDGSWQAPPLAEQWPAGGLEVVWKQPIGGGYAGVSVADGRVFTLDRQTQPREVERVVCLELATGRMVWRHEYPVSYGKLDYGNGPRAAPTVIDGRVFTLGAMGHALCLDANTGQPVWTVDTVARHGARVPEWGFAASPLVWEDRVIVHVGAREGGCFLALDRTRGDLRWKAGDDPAGYATPRIIAHPGGRPQLVGWTPEHVLGIDPSRGEVEWQIPYKVTYGVSIATPMFVDGIVFVAGYWEGAKAIRLGTERSDARLIYEDTRLLRGLMSQPLYRDGHAYLLDKQHGLTCFELATGHKLWDDANRLTPRGRNPQASLVWLGDSDRFLALNAEGELVQGRLRPGGYEETARAKIIGFTWAHPGFQDRLVIARSDQELVCVQLPGAEDSGRGRRTAASSFNP
ncbi:MAG: PQQ-binding-like beta-propeller repeat protein [Pirellulaceae bacterium]